MADDSKHKKGKGTKLCVIKRRLMVKNYKDCFFNNKIILKSQQRFRSDHHNVYTEQINKIALSSNDWKHLIKLQCIHTEQTHSNYAKVGFEETVKYKWLVLMIMQVKTKQSRI